MSSLSNMSDLLMASILSLSNNSGLYFFNSLSKILYSSFMSLESAGIKNNKVEFRSICLKNLIPSPFPRQHLQLFPEYLP